MKMLITGKKLRGLIVSNIFMCKSRLNIKDLLTTYQIRGYSTMLGKVLSGKA